MKALPGQCRIFDFAVFAPQLSVNLGLNTRNLTQRRKVAKAPKAGEFYREETLLPRLNQFCSDAK